MVAAAIPLSVLAIDHGQKIVSYGKSAFGTSNVDTAANDLLDIAAVGSFRHTGHCIDDDWGYLGSGRVGANRRG
jgi:hypothetical protein